MDNTACHDAQLSGTGFFSSNPTTNYSKGGMPEQFHDAPLQANNVDRRASDDDSSTMTCQMKGPLILIATSI